MDWIKISLILCLFGFLKEFRPGEAFVTEYLVTWKNFTSKQVTEEIYPIGTYSYLGNLILMLLLTDFLRYKPIIILCGISGIVTFSVLTFGRSLTSMKLYQMGFGLYLSTDVAYYTYIYAKTDTAHYQKVSSYTRSAFLFGRFIASSLSQILISFDLLNYHQLNYLTIAGQVLATISAVTLPTVKQSTYFHPKIPSALRNQISTHNSDNSDQQNVTVSSVDVDQTFMEKIQHAYYLLWKDFLKAYTNWHVLKWSFWWAAANCGYLQVLIFSQPVWQTAVKQDQRLYNGLVEALYSIIGAIAVFFVSMLKLNWSYLGEAILSLFTWIEAIILFVISRNYNLWVLYTLHIIFGVIYHMMVTVASSEVAKKISQDSYGLIFGINIAVSLAMESLLTFIVTSGNVFKLDIRSQFAVYAGYFAFFAAIFAVIAVHSIIISFRL